MQLRSATGTYEFVISGIGEASVSAFDAEILIPKQNSGYGSKALTVTTRVNDGYHHARGDN